MLLKKLYKNILDLLDYITYKNIKFILKNNNIKFKSFLSFIMCAQESKYFINIFNQYLLTLH